MVTPTKTVANGYTADKAHTPIAYYEFSGLSSDSKPTSFEGTEVANGSVFLEMNTSKVYAYDKAGDTWREL